ncbi:MAG: universal stress protein [Candidatus Acidiferrales bacterium]|jgi:nucleotide-binding universal stress UspA family protein
MKILLAVDDSPYSREATRNLLAQFQAQNAEVRVLSVVEPIGAYISADLFPHFTPQVEEIEEDRKTQATALVSQIANKLQEAGFKTSELVDFGDAKTVIIDNAAKWGADLIVLGSHGWKGLNRFLLGSVSDAVARHAPCSVEIVRVRPAVDAAKTRSQ